MKNHIFFIFVVVFIVVTLGVDYLSNSQVITEDPTYQADQAEITACMALFKAKDASGELAGDDILGKLQSFSKLKEVRKMKVVVQLKCGDKIHRNAEKNG